MIYRIDVTDEAKKVLSKYKKSNPISFKKIVRLMPDLEKHPRTGIGHPEPLVAGNSITYSRRISAKDRIVYDIYDETATVIVLSVEGHYGDK